ncbi:MAG: four helix bundle protein [Lentimicrobium sp.]|nr:four helix bundle protein [Lentimicrobium sp.]
MKDRLEEVRFYNLSMELWDEMWTDTETLMLDFRGKEIARQLVRSVGSISANIEEGYGRGFGKEYPQFLRISRGSARESKGWYRKSSHLLEPEIINARILKLDDIISMETKAIQTLETKTKH